MATPRKGIWQALVSAALVAIGVAALLGVLFGAIGSLMASLGGAGRRVEESVSIAVDGTPVISMDSYAVGGSVTLSRRTLDGKEFPIDYQHWLWFTSLKNRVPPPGVFFVPPRWNYGELMMGGTDGRRPPAAWYLIRDRQRLGHSYFAGYDAFSKLPVGFIGRDGFQASLPGTDSRFALPDTNQPVLWPFFTTSQGFQQGVVYDYDIYNRGPIPGWLVFLIEGDKLWEVDLRQRSSRPKLDAPDLVSISLMNSLKANVESLPAPDKAAASKHATPFRFAAATQDVLYDTFQAIPPTATFQPIPPTAASGAAPDEPEPEYGTVLALRTNDKIIMYNPEAGGRRDFVVPEKLRPAEFDVAWIAPEKLLLQSQAGFWSGGPIKNLSWTDTTGKVERETELKLSGWTPISPRQLAWNYFSAAQVPIAWLFGVLIVAPLVLLQNHRAASFTNGLAQTFDDTWLPLLLILALAAVFAWLTIKIQRKYRRTSSGLWAAFVFLLGPAGFIAYLLQHRRPKLETCVECGAIVPRNRDVCAACSAPFPAAPRVGTEILA